MLVLKRDKEEILDIFHAGERLELRILDVRGGAARLGIDGPRSFIVLRREISLTKGLVKESEDDAA